MLGEACDSTSLVLAVLSVCLVQGLLGWYDNSSLNSVLPPSLLADSVVAVETNETHTGRLCGRSGGVLAAGPNKLSAM